ncbi:hypothetical protein JG687_00005643 [Phytophthora cactorum]|uniref:RxLR effector protein n=1 Tax=Phytophthora cactorum TaxID=29920 RepID=A0A8T1UN69_9STRA|nr:hypothetical protein JG687_00005643 [Phytophthora cactorum]
MRRCYVLIAMAAILLSHSGVSAAPSDSSQNKLVAVNGAKAVKYTGTAERFLRRYAESDTRDNEERQWIALNTRIIDMLFGTSEKIVDPKLVDVLLGGTKIKAELDAALTRGERQVQVFEHWHAQDIKPRAITELLNIHPALEKRYRFVYTMYEGFVMSADANKLAKLKKKRSDI